MKNKDRKKREGAWKTTFENLEDFIFWKERCALEKLCIKKESRKEFQKIDMKMFLKIGAFVGTKNSGGPKTRDSKNDPKKPSGNMNTFSSITSVQWIPNRSRPFLYAFIT